jgi:hypothetical protein
MPKFSLRETLTTDDAKKLPAREEEMTLGHSNFNPPFSEKCRKQKQAMRAPKAERKPAEDFRQRYAGVLASRSTRVKPSMPKMPWETLDLV